MTSRKIPESAVENLVSDLEGKANVSLSNLSAAGQAKFDAKANTDASNFNADGKSLLSGLGMPSSRYIDLTLGATGSTYTAPANGWFYFLGKWTNADSYFQMRNITISSLQPRIQTMSVIASGYLGLYMPVRAGDNIAIDYHIAPTNVNFAFIYAQGEQ